MGSEDLAEITTAIDGMLLMVGRYDIALRDVLVEKIREYGEARYSCIFCERLEAELDRECRVHNQALDTISAQRQEIAELKEANRGIATLLLDMRYQITKILGDAKIRQGWRDVRDEGATKGSWTR